MSMAVLLLVVYNFTSLNVRVGMVGVTGGGGRCGLVLGRRGRVRGGGLGGRGGGVGRVIGVGGAGAHHGVMHGWGGFAN